jgi:hypothetical protein
MAKIKYTPPESVKGFLRSNSFINLIVGPIGSTKTTAGIVKIALEAKKMAPCEDGIRRSRYIWVRQTREQLRDSSIPDFLKWFPDGQAGLFMKTDYRYIMKFDDVESEVLFRGLDDSSDVRRLLSLQASGAIIEEFRELNPDIFEALQGRLGRYPDGMLVPHRPEWGHDVKGNAIQGCVTEYGQQNMRLWGMSNPPDMDTYWEDFISNPPENAEVFIQPSGLSEDADWVKYLPSGYYDNLANGKTQDWIDVYIHAKFGKSLSGKPVFRSFSRDVHVADKELKPYLRGGNPVLVGFDCTGLNPAAVIGQLSWTGQLQIFEAFAAKEMGALRFIREVLKPKLVNTYAGASVLVIIDPAGMARDTEERTVKDLLETEGLSTIPASTNQIAARIAAVESYLTKTVEGASGLLIDPRADQLIQALAGKYRFKVKTSGEAEDKPDKSHPWADIADALQYLCLHADGGAIFGALVGNDSRQIVKAPIRWSR